MVSFPQAYTQKLPDHGWVSQLASEDHLYVVKHFLSSGEAILTCDGFFARETHVLQMTYICMAEELHPVSIDGPFLAFYADDTGVHAAAWFDRDSFIQTVPRPWWHLR